MGQAIHLKPHNLALHFNLALVQEQMAIAVLQKPRSTVAEVQRALDHLQQARKCVPPPPCPVPRVAVPAKPFTADRVFNWLNENKTQPRPYSTTKAAEHARLCLVRPPLSPCLICSSC